jgi:hypothetical protein
MWSGDLIFRALRILVKLIQHKEAKMHPLNWTDKNKSGKYIPLNDVPLDNVKTYGVYVIWHGGQNPKTVRVGQGKIKDRIFAHREDKLVQAYAHHGLFVTWAAVSPSLVDGIERYLSECLRPLVGERFPDVRPIEVNSPFAN